MRTKRRLEARSHERTMTEVYKTTQNERITNRKRLQRKIDNLMCWNGAALEVIEAMRKDNEVQRGIMDLN